MHAIHAIVALFFLSALFTCDPNGEATKKELTKLTGRWKAQWAYVENGEKISFEDSLILTFKGTSLTTITGEKEKATYKEKNRITLDATKVPKILDVRVLDGKDKGKIFRGIYTFEGNDLKICWSAIGGGERPTKFAYNSKKSHNLVSFKRQK